jgi:hypothetical protein
MFDYKIFSKKFVSSENTSLGRCDSIILSKYKIHAQDYTRIKLCRNDYFFLAVRHSSILA